MMIKKIPNFSNYGATKDGRIWSYISDKFLIPCKSHGYHVIYLRKNNKKYCKKIHRLVLEAFIGLCPEDMECCHNNGIRTNNRLENLRWDTRSNNIKDAIRHGTFTQYGPSYTLFKPGEKHPNAKLTEQNVRDIRNMYKTKRYTHEHIAKLYSVSRRLIGKIVNRIYWKYT